MRVGVVGLGHVGLVTGVCMAHLGHEVAGWDDDRSKMATIAAGRAPFFETGLPELIAEGLSSGSFRVADRVEDVARHSEVVLICVGIPITATGDSDLSGVERVVSRLVPHIQGYTVLAEKSTVPVGTGAWMTRRGEWTKAAAEFDVASTPEFLREGQAVEDTLRPTRIVVGANTDRAHAVLRELFEPILRKSGCPYVATDLVTAELIKLASNAFLATKISFINMVADVCEATGSDIEVVAEAMGLDPRIGSAFLRPGIGYGGACLPKDVIAFRTKAEQLGVEASLLAGVAKVNEQRPAAALQKVRSLLGDLVGRRIAVWGLAFKAATDDVRESRALDLVRLLLDAGATVGAYDPAVKSIDDEDLVQMSRDAYEVVIGADALVICTDWAEFGSVDLTRVRAAMRGNLIVDGRNMLDPRAASASGFVYASVGRPVAYPTSGGGKA